MYYIVELDDMEISIILQALRNEHSFMYDWDNKSVDCINKLIQKIEMSVDKK